MFRPSLLRVISIHTPIQGVVALALCHIVVLISIHTPIQGVVAEMKSESKDIYFNTHSHTGSGGITQEKKFSKYFNTHSHTGSGFKRTRSGLFHVISIHTPIQGVVWDSVPAKSFDDFNTHSHTGSG